MFKYNVFVVINTKKIYNIFIDFYWNFPYCLWYQPETPISRQIAKQEG
jgi:hypothetical protein